MNDALTKLLWFLLLVVCAVGAGALCFWIIGYIGVQDILYRIAVVAIVISVIATLIFGGRRIFGGPPLP